MSHVSASPPPESALPLVALRRWATVSVGTAAALTFAQFAGILHPHHPAFFVFVLTIVALYIATAVVAFLAAIGLYRVARYPSLRTYSAARPFFIWVSSTAAVVVCALALGGVR